MKPKRKLLLLLGLLLGLAILLPMVTLLVWTYRVAAVQPAPITIPNPNGYDKLLEAAAAIKGGTVWDLDAIGPAGVEELTVFLDQNARAIELARAALEHESLVPIQFTPQGNLEVRELRRVARMFAAAGRRAEFQGKDDEAIEFYVDCIRTGQAAHRGGLLIPVMVGLAYESLGVQRLRELMSRLNRKQRLALSRTLHDLEIERETVDDLVARERQWAIKTYGWTAIVGILFTFNHEELAETTVRAIHRGDLRRRLLMTELAIQAYRDETGALPEELEELVPNFLPAVLNNPFDGQPISYERLDEGYRLFGLGPYRRATEMIVPLTLDNLD